MRKYEITRNIEMQGETIECYPELYIVGSTAEIKATYKSICRNRNTDLHPIFAECPKFSDRKQSYALRIDCFNTVMVVNSDTMLSILIDRKNIIKGV